MPAAATRKPTKTKKTPEPSPPDPAALPVRERGPTQLVRLSEIMDDDENHRIPTAADKAKIKELTASIRTTGGVLVPIELYRDFTGKLRKVDGYRRCEAALAAGLTQIEAYVLSYLPTPAEREARRAIYNIHREQLNPAEECIAVVRVVEGTSGNIAAAAAELGKSETWVRERLYLQKLHPKVRDWLVAGKLNLGQARELTKVSDPKTQVAFADQVIDEQGAGQVVSIEELRSWIEDEQRPLDRVLWRLDVPFAGKPACNTCPYNTATNMDLFGTPKGEARCTFEDCYDVKLRKVGEEEKKFTEKVRERVKRKQIESAEAGSIGIAREVTPEFMDPDAVQKILRATVVKPAAAKKTAANGQAETPEKAAPKKEPTEKERRRQAALEWSQKFQEWRDKLADRLGRMTLKDSRLKMVASWMADSQSLTAHPAYNAFSTGGVEPPEENPISPKLSILFNAAVEDTFDPVKLVEDMNNYHQVSLGGMGPELIKRVAEVFGFDMNDPLAQPPEFEDFLPDDLKLKPRDWPRDGKGNLVVEKGQHVSPPGQKDFCQKGCYVVVTATKAVGESMGYQHKSNNTVNVKIASGAVRPHFVAELRAATEAEVIAFENSRKE